MSDFNPNINAIIPPPAGSTIRGHDVAIDDNDLPEQKIGLERINSILFNYLDRVINITIDANDAVRKIPVVYADAERWKLIRADGFLRDPNTNKALTPLLTLRRSSVKPRPLINNPNNKYLYTTVSSGWSEKYSYDRFSVLNGIRPVQQIRNIMIPDYIDITYEGLIWTDYQTQMDEIIQIINTENHEFWGERNDFKFRVEIDGFETQNELPAQDERIIRSAFNMKVSGYILPERVLQNMKIASTQIKVNTSRKFTFFTEVVGNLEK